MPSPIGALSKPQSIAKWILECCTDEVTNAAGNKTDLSHIALCHSPSDKEIYVQPMKGKAMNPEALISIAETIYGRAESDAEGLPSRQSYMLYAFYEGCNNHASRRKPIQVNGRIVNELGDHSTEPATGEGRMMQRMRHDEGYSQVLVHGNAAIVQQSINFGTVMAERALKSEERYGEMFLKMQQILMDVTLAREKQDMERLQYERNSKMIEQGLKLLPAILNTVTGKEIVPVATQDTAIVEALAEAMDEETTQKVLTAVGDKIPAGTMGLFFSRMAEIAEKKAKGQERVSQALAKPLNTEHELGVNGTGAKH